MDMCIVCAMAEEARTLMDVIARKRNVTFLRAFSSQTKREYYHTVIENIDGESLSIHVSWQPGYGPIETGLHLKPVLEEFRPCFVAMTGICAGDKQQVTLGDIVVAERAFFYDTGKFVLGEDGQKEHLHDAGMWQPHPDVIHFVRGFDGWQQAVADLQRPYSRHQQRDWLLNRLMDKTTPRIDDIERQELEQHTPDWRKIVRELQASPNPYLTRERALKDPSSIHELYYGEERFPYIDPAKPGVHIAPMASGSAVRSDDPFREIRMPVRGIVAIDMEGASFYRIMAEFPEIRFLLAKGVSDYADSDKDDSYHQYAAAVSATYMLAFITEYITSKRMPGLKPALTAKETRALIPSSSSTSVQPIEDEHILIPARQDALNVFYSYAPEDERLRKKLETHLAVLRRLGLITQWYSHNISGGQKEAQEVMIHLSQAQIILLLISPDFLASDACYEREMLPALAMQEDGRARVIPILLRSIEGLEETPLGELLVIPRNRKPIVEWLHLDAAFAEIVEEIKVVIAQMREKGY